MSVTAASAPGVPGSARPIVPGVGIAKALGGWAAVSILVGAATYAVATVVAPGLAADSVTLTAVIVFEVYALLVGSLYVFLGRAGGLHDVLRLRFTSKEDLLLGVAVGLFSWSVVVVAYLAVGLLDDLLDALMFYVGSDGGRLGSLGPIVAGLSLLRACLVAPLAEELLFRGALFGWLRRRLPAWPAILVSAVLFGAVHISPILMPAGFILGVGLGWLRERTGSILPGLVFHIANNAVVVAVTFAMTGWK